MLRRAFLLVILPFLFLGTSISRSEPGQIVGLLTDSKGGFDGAGFWYNGIKLVGISLSDGKSENIVELPTGWYSSTAYAKDPFSAQIYLQRRAPNDISHNQLIAINLESNALSPLALVSPPFANFVVDGHTGDLCGLVYEVSGPVNFFIPNRGGYRIFGKTFSCVNPNTGEITLSYSPTELNNGGIFNPTILGHNLEKSRIYLQQFKPDDTNPIIEIDFEKIRQTQVKDRNGLSLTVVNKEAIPPLASVSTYDPYSQTLFGLKFAFSTGSFVVFGSPLEINDSGASFFRSSLGSSDVSNISSKAYPHAAFFFPKDPDSDLAYTQYYKDNIIAISSFDINKKQWNAPIAQLEKPLHLPVLDIPTLDYVALGDSYSAGTGAGNYFDLPSKHSNGNNLCHRSGNAYSMSDEIDKLYPSFRLRRWFYACNGAETINIIPQNEPLLWAGAEGYTNDAEPEQATRIGLKHADIVSLTIGGNDGQFGPVVKEMLKQIKYTESALPEELFKKLGMNEIYNSDGTPLFNEELRKAFTVESAISRGIDLIIAPKLSATYEVLIKSSKPEAKIYHLGYPHVFPEISTTEDVQAIEDCLNGIFLQPFINGITQDELEAANRLTDKLNDTIRNISEAYGAHFVDVVDQFRGHEACAKKAYINNIDLFSATKNAPFISPYESFHPNMYGHGVYAKALSNAIKANNAQPPQASFNLTASTFVDSPQITETESQNETNPPMATLGKLTIDLPQDGASIFLPGDIATVHGQGFLPGAKVILLYRDSRNDEYTALEETFADTNGHLEHEIILPPLATDKREALRVIQAGGMTNSTTALVLSGVVYVANELIDSDGDDVPDSLDNCKGVANTDQEDWDGDSKGDSCDPVAITGGGYAVTPNTTFRTNFSVNLNGPSNPAGWVKFYESKSRMSFIGTTVDKMDFSIVDNRLRITVSGQGTLQGTAGYGYKAFIEDGSPEGAADRFGLTIIQPASQGSGIHLDTGAMTLSGGNFIQTN
ncbi:GDSL-type esterase/lipase family protein [Desulfobulbus sp.]|uniref:GDSL-type esterase/lipase family protein n=1 Tax=Desulfobulbus sp. TaxID=895 RepID=UPI0027B9DDA7|nr:GDSL-type esterase/lipase family protein [Desulfobulbus sp.]